MKALKFLALSALALLLSAPAFAQTTQAVNVGVTLVNKCEFTSAALAFTPAYTAFQAAALTDSVSATIQCTRGATAPTFTWDGAASATTVGLVRGLTYQLVATLGAVAAGSPPNGTDVTNLGVAKTAPVTIALTVPGGQAGQTGGADVPRTLTVVF